jgi:hypothetical protein
MQKTNLVNVFKNVNHRIQQEPVNCHKKWENDIEHSVVN